MVDGGVSSNQGFKVTSEDLLAHARMIAGLATDLGNALTLVEGVSLGDHAYGEKLRAVAVAVAGVGHEGVAAVRDGVDALNLMVTMLRDNANNYANSDDTSQTAFQRIDERMARG